MQGPSQDQGGAFGLSAWRAKKFGGTDAGTAQETDRSAVGAAKAGAGASADQTPAATVE